MYAWNSDLFPALILWREALKINNNDEEKINIKNSFREEKKKKEQYRIYIVCRPNNLINHIVFLGKQNMFPKEKYFQWNLP